MVINQNLTNKLKNVLDEGEILKAKLSAEKDINLLVQKDDFIYTILYLGKEINNNDKIINRLGIIFINNEDINIKKAILDIALISTNKLWIKFIFSPSVTYNLTEKSYYMNKRNIAFSNFKLLLCQLNSFKIKEQEQVKIDTTHQVYLSGKYLWSKKCSRTCRQSQGIYDLVNSKYDYFDGGLILVSSNGKFLLSLYNIDRNNFDRYNLAVKNLEINCENIFENVYKKSVKISDNEKYLLYCSTSSKNWIVHDLENNKVITEFKMFTSYSHYISEDGNLLLSFNQEDFSSKYVVDIESNKVLEPIKDVFDLICYTFDINFNNNYLYYEISQERSWVIFDLVNNIELMKFFALEKPQFSQKGKYLFYKNNEVIILIQINGYFMT